MHRAQPETQENHITIINSIISSTTNVHCDVECSDLKPNWESDERKTYSLLSLIIVSNNLIHY